MTLLRTFFALFGITVSAPRIPHAERLAIGGAITRRRRAGLWG
ncbi:MAG: hypothetical protein RLO01_12305 [Thalassobaculaceae bacterium]